MVTRLLLILAVLTACEMTPAGLLDGVCGPIVLPLEVVPEPEVDPAVVDYAVAFWNEASVLPLFEVADRWEECRDLECLGVALVFLATPEDETALAEADLYVQRGQVHFCAISLHPTWPVEEHILAHELGHCLGLADGGSGGNIMQSRPTPPDGQVHPDDVQAVLRGCEEP